MNFRKDYYWSIIKWRAGEARKGKQRKVFSPFVSLVVRDLTNQQFVNCAYLEILCPSPPSLPVCLCRDKPSCLCILGSVRNLLWSILT